jgi:hypothetical protein
MIVFEMWEYAASRLQVQIAIEDAGFEFFRLTKLSSVVMLSALK